MLGVKLVAVNYRGPPRKIVAVSALLGLDHPHNLALGEADRQTFYLTAQTGIYRIRLNNPDALAFAKGL